MSNHTIIAALEAALANQPNDNVLLLHLAALLMQDSQYEKALICFQRVLVQNPVDQSALKGAQEAAVKLNNSALANAYQQLLMSLTQSSANSVNDTLLTPGTHQSELIKNQDSEQIPPRVRGTPLRLVSDKVAAEAFMEIEDSQVYLNDVGGMEQVKRRLNLAFLAPLKNPEMMQAYGKSVRGGLLLYGPPGCGKTFIARALAGELGAKFVTVGLTDILDMYIGESERKLHEIFVNARRHAPVVLFIDELDAVGQKRSQLRHSGLRGLVNQLLTEMDSIGNDNRDLFILAATNHPWDIDTALRRPGRFDRMIAVFPPDLAARSAILAMHLKNKPIGAINIQYLAERTPLFSGADLAYLCQSAVEFALEESLDTGKVRELEMNDFLRALKEIKPSTLPWFESARNYAMFANESGAYDDLLEFIRVHKL